MSTITETKKKGKSLGIFDIFLGIICLMLFIDTIGPTAAMGPSSITWYLIIAAIFVLPTGLITAELGATYPDEGGMYAWVKRAYGSKWGARTTWCYWSNMAIYVSSAAIFVVQVFSQLFFPEISFFWQIVSTVILIWVYMFIAMQPMKNSKWVNNIGAIFKITIILGMIICAIIYMVKQGTPANDLSAKAFIPTLGASFIFFPALIYNVMGFEAMSTMGSQMKNPSKDVPRAIIINVFFIVGLYILATLSMLFIVPYEDMNIVEGIMNCFIYTLGTGGIGRIAVVLVGIMFLFSLISQSIVWIVASCTMSAESSLNNELPDFYGKTHKKHGTPLGSIILMGIISTVVTIIYGSMAGSAEDLFWTLFSFLSIIF
ncbi:MAG: APC family permease, partial [Clostridiales bacterium]